MGPLGRSPGASRSTFINRSYLPSKCKHCRGVTVKASDSQSKDCEFESLYALCKDFFLHDVEKLELNLLFSPTSM